MNTYQITDLSTYFKLINSFAGVVFHRIDEQGRHLIKPLKRFDEHISKFGTKIGEE